jgi:membrane protein
MEKYLKKFDRYQQTTRFLGFIVAVIKKYSEDETSRQGALLTYYLFLSLFPLLLVLTTIADHLVGRGSNLSQTIINGVTNYFPLLGSQLSGHVHSLHRNGVPLIFGLLFIFYGTHGVADTFGRGVRQIWGVDNSQMSGFPRSTLRSLKMIIFGGTGFILASICAGLAASAGHGLEFRSLSVLVNLIIIFWLFSFLINAVLPRHVTVKEIRGGAATATIGLVVLQLLGGYLVSRELRNLDALYSYFAVALGLLFWLYLQVQVIYYAIEISIVNSRQLWPRSLISN